MVLIAHAADIHLGYAQYGLLEREMDIYEAFEELVETVRRERPDLLLIAGDLFDSPRPPIKALMRARELLGNLRSSGIRICHVIGDHELPRRVKDLPPTAILEGISDYIGFQNISVGDEIVITGLDRVRLSERDEVMRRLGQLAEDARRFRKRVLLAHAPLRGPENMVKDLPRGYSYYALGHEHDRRIFSLDGSAAAYSGSIEILSTAEIEGWSKSGKGFLLIDLSGDEPIIQEVSLSSIRPQKLISASMNDLERALEEAASWSSAQRKKPIIHVRVRGKAIDRQPALRIIQEKLAGKVLHYRYEVLEEVEEVGEIEGAPAIDVRAMIREHLLSRGFREDYAELAVAIYDAYIGRGIEEVERLIFRRLGELEK
ncbi:MAG: DNA repair exonuclease [Nitrososphaerota archaeon]